MKKTALHGETAYEGIIKSGKLKKKIFRKTKNSIYNLLKEVKSEPTIYYEYYLRQLHNKFSALDLPNIDFNVGTITINLLYSNFYRVPPLLKCVY